MTQPERRPVFAVFVLILVAIPFAVLAYTQLRIINEIVAGTPRIWIPFGLSAAAAISLVVVAVGLGAGRAWAWYGAVTAFVGIVIAGISAVGGGIYTIATLESDPFGFTRFAALGLCLIGIGLTLVAARGVAILRAQPPAVSLRSAPQAAIVVGLLVVAVTWLSLLEPLLR